MKTLTPPVVPNQASWQSTIGYQPTAFLQPMHSNKVKQFQRDPCLVLVARKIQVILYLCLKKISQGCLSRTEFVIPNKLIVMRWVKKVQLMRVVAQRLAKQKSTLKNLVVREVGGHLEKGPMMRTDFIARIHPRENFLDSKAIQEGQRLQKTTQFRIAAPASVVVGRLGASKAGR